MCSVNMSVDVLNLSKKIERFADNLCLINTMLIKVTKCCNFYTLYSVNKPLKCDAGNPSIIAILRF